MVTPDDGMTVVPATSVTTKAATLQSGSPALYALGAHRHTARELRPALLPQRELRPALLPPLRLRALSALARTIRHNVGT
eukprot:6860227-Prymnesium_polylepis.1